MPLQAPSKNDLPDLASRALASYLDRSGAVLYSSHDTIKPGKIYLFGLNPGGQGGPTLQKNISLMLSRQENAYLDERWENGRELPEPGKAVLQRRVNWLLTQLGAQTRDVLATNLIFMQSRDASGVSSDLADVCWPVHEALLNIVRPSLIVAYGNSTFSPYGYLHGRFGGEQRYGTSGHGDWMLKGFDARMSWGSVFVAGLPHLSRYDPTRKQGVVDWIESGGRSRDAL